MAQQARYRWGIVAPMTGHSEQLEGAEPLLPPSIEIVQAMLGVKDYTRQGVDEAMTRYWACVDQLVQQGVQRLTFAGVPLSAQLGRPRVLQLLEQTQQRTGLVADAANESIIAALEHLGAASVAIASRFPDQVNDAIVAYFEAAGLRVPTITRRDQWARDIAGESIEAGIKLAAELGREAMRRAPDADALLLPGGSWRALAVVPLLEEDFGKPVITNATARAWRLMHAGLAPAKPGWGVLLASP
jgi:maleate cis-trans isomerase